nr:DUF551 domain-containing protein [Pseudomonas sp. UBA6718]
MSTENLVITREHLPGLLLARTIWENGGPSLYFPPALQDATDAARAAQPAPVVPDWYKLVKVGQGCVTSAMKAECIGDFSFGVTMSCGECVDIGADSDCPVCGGEVEYEQKITVPWDTCKEIYKGMLAAAPAQGQQSPNYWRDLAVANRKVADEALAALSALKAHPEAYQFDGQVLRDEHGNYLAEFMAYEQSFIDRLLHPQPELKAQQVGQEPAGEVHLRKGGGISLLHVELAQPLPPGTKLYTAPQPALAQDVAGWIPVTERLPEVETDVLVRGVRRNEVMHRVAGLFNGEWSSQETEDLLLGEVTHWMPLPAAPATHDKQSGEVKP